MSRDIKLFTVEDYQIFDKLAEEYYRNPTSGPLGWVRVYLESKSKKEKVHEGPNLVVGQGRQFVAQKIFNKASGASGSNAQDNGGTNWNGFTITHFGVGSGGATVNGGVVTINGPYITDSGLFSPISLRASNGGNYLSSISNSGSTITASAKRIEVTEDGGSITFENVQYSGRNYSTRVKCVCVVNGNAESVNGAEPTSLVSDTDSVQISEAGLFITSGATARLFAHICFAPKYKEKASTFKIEWYILC